MRERSVRPALTRFLVLVMAAVIVSCLCFLAFGFALWGLIVGVILLDLVVQACQVSSMIRVHALGDEARNRINTVYMVSYFAGGALGSLLASYGYALFGGCGVCAGEACHRSRGRPGAPPDDEARPRGSGVKGAFRPASGRAGTPPRGDEQPSRSIFLKSILCRKVYQRIGTPRPPPFRPA